MARPVDIHWPILARAGRQALAVIENEKVAYCCFRPVNWRTIGQRSSPYHLAGNRNAAHPVNAILNYAYAALESEIRIKAISEGYDPTIGIMHEGTDGSSKFVFDLMESERPKVDRAGVGSDRQPEAESDPIVQELLRSALRAGDAQCGAAPSNLSHVVSVAGPRKDELHCLRRHTGRRPFRNRPAGSTRDRLACRRPRWRVRGLVLVGLRSSLKKSRGHGRGG
jgi:hypothetical protein